MSNGPRHPADLEDALERMEEIEGHVPFKTPRSEAYLESDRYIKLYLSRSSRLELMVHDGFPRSGPPWYHGSLWLYREHRYNAPSLMVFVYHDDEGRYGAAPIPVYHSRADRETGVRNLYKCLGTHQRVMEALGMTLGEVSGRFDRERRGLEE